ESRQRSKVIVMMDASLSMSVTRDDIPPPGKSFKDMPTRTQILTDMLVNERIDFMGRLAQKNPVTSYRFARNIDNDYLLFEKNELGVPLFWPRGEREQLVA